MIDRTRYPDLHKPSKGYVFVVTYGRSGSTLTQALLNSIPGYCIRGENANATGHIAQLLHSMRNHKTAQNRRSRYEAYLSGEISALPGNMGTPNDPWYGAELVDTARMGRAMFDVFVREVLQLPEGVRVGGFKEIRYIEQPRFLPHHLKVLQEFFPGAKLILQTRAHDEVAKSSWWQNKDPDVLARQLVMVDTAFANYQASHPDCFHLDYATYRKGPQALRPLFDFLGETYDEDMVCKVLQTPLDHGKLKSDKTKAVLKEQEY